MRYAVGAVGETFHCPDCTAAVPIIRLRLKRDPEATEPPPAAASSPKGAKRGFLGFTKKSWGLVNCLTGQQSQIDKFPFEIGSAEAVDLRLEDIAPNQCALVETKQLGICITPRDTTVKVVLNGKLLESPTQLKTEADYSLQIGSHFFVLRGGRGTEKWAKTINTKQWLMQNLKTNKTAGPMEFEPLTQLVKDLNSDAQTTILYPKGATIGFYLSQINDTASLRSNQPANNKQTVLADAARSASSGFTVRSDSGKLICPVCWLRFDKGDVMHVAAHESLRGDPLLGDDEMLRFAATRYNNSGQALDAVGVPCQDTACPHCRRRLSPGFMDVPHKIISLVGETTAGKSYYLSVAAKVLPEVLFRHFNVVFKDADPAGNRHLNAMKNRLFSGATPEQVRLEKTQAQGDLYERVFVYGQETRLPMPFMFAVSPADDSASRQGVVFYDLAGELFQPGASSYDAMKTQHVAVAATVLFLFDPTLSRGFRLRLQNHPDPQLQSRQLDQQDTLLAEMEVRIKRLLNLDGRARVKTPLAILVGKCDIWLPLLGEAPLDPVLNGAGLDLGAINRNSQRIRAFLTDIAPNIVANAESLSEDVTFFAVSSFGHSPVRLPDGNLAPDPQLLHPLYVEQPFLWALAKTMPNMLAITKSTAE